MRSLAGDTPQLGITAPALGDRRTQTLSGEADDLKEYTIGIEALGKPSDYNPQIDSSVRVHASKLRQKLDDYYRDEGVTDEVLIRLPKGHHKLAFEERSYPETVAAVPQLLMPQDVATARALDRWKVDWRLLCGALAILAAVLAAATTMLVVRTRNTNDWPCDGSVDS